MSPSTSMPPPPSPLLHRRTRLNTNVNTSDPSLCGPRKMSLSKGATFHSSSSSASDLDPVLSIRYLSRRSPTCSHDSLSSLLSEKRGLAAHAIADFEETFSGARGPSRTTRRRSAEAFNQQLKDIRPVLPTDEGLGSSVSSPSEKGISKSLAQVELDSGLGESIDGSVVEGDISDNNNYSGQNSPAAEILVQDTDRPNNTSIQTRQQSRNLLRLRTTTSSSQTPKPQPTSTPSAPHPSLSRFAKKKISELLFTPLLKEDRFRALHPLVTQLGSRVNKNIRCLRDLERSLIFQPLTRAPSVSSHLYRSFGELTIQLVVDTYSHLSETEQRRVTDRPYTNGYFLDLVQQVGQLASHIGTSSRAREAGEEVNEEEAFSIEDEVTLEGGLSNTGDFAELVRWKNGKGISLRTGLPFEPMAGLKRQHSTMTDEEIARSMARRKKGYIPEIVEMKCSDPDCDKIFTRKCDLSKHEKTHSRPFKCPDKKCKYHSLGLPTEKERDRHMNDKHDPNPRLYPCMFCEFKTKRESNCKQHMEKKHGWDYRRVKGKDRDSGSTPSATPQTNTIDYSPAVVKQSPAQTNFSWDDHSSVAGSLVDSVHGSTRFTPLDEPTNNFDGYDAGFQSMPLFPRQPPQGAQYIQTNNQLSLEVPNHNAGYDQFQGYISPVRTTPDSLQMRMTPVTPAYSTFTPQGHSPYVENMNYVNGGSNTVNWQDGLPTPDSAAQPYSRHQSVQYESPLLMKQVYDTNDVMLGQDFSLPQNDFDLQIPQDDFALNLSAFTTSGDPNQTLFNEADIASQQYEPHMFEGVDMDMDMDMGAEVDDTYGGMVDFNGH